MDKVDQITRQWARERPDLNVRPMGLIGRLARLAHHQNRVMEKNFSQHDLNAASFDVLATLRRSGAPFALSPGDLMQSMMVTSGTVTHRIDQLVKVGWVERNTDGSDARKSLVTLTDKGFAKIEGMVHHHVAVQAELVVGLSSEEFAQLNSLLGRYLVTVEGITAGE